MAELVYAADSKSVPARVVGSNPTTPTQKTKDKDMTDYREVIASDYDYKAVREDVVAVLASDESDLAKLKEIGFLVGFDYLESEWGKPKEQSVPWKAIK